MIQNVYSTTQKQANQRNVSDASKDIISHLLKGSVLKLIETAKSIILATDTVTIAITDTSRFLGNANS